MCASFVITNYASILLHECGAGYSRTTGSTLDQSYNHIRFRRFNHASKSISSYYFSMFFSSRYRLRSSSSSVYSITRHTLIKEISKKNPKKKKFRCYLFDTKIISNSFYQNGTLVQSDFSSSDVPFTRSHRFPPIHSETQTVFQRPFP